MRNPANVLPLYDPPRQKAYRAAVARMIRELKAREGLSNTALGEEIGCCGETISNAENEHNDLNPVTLLRIAYHFGEEAIEPVRQLYLRSHVEPLTVSERFDALQIQIETIRKEVA